MTAETWAKDSIITIAGSDEFLPTFRDWLVTHWHMWERFKEAADRVAASRRTNYSAFVIVNVLRYRADIVGVKFSMTNTFVPDLARLYNRTAHNLFNVSTRKKRNDHV